jgi:hypothetical protein
MSQAKLFVSLLLFHFTELILLHRTLRPPPNIDFVQGQLIFDGLHLPYIFLPL